MHVACPRCTQTLEIHDAYQGQIVACGNCAEEFQAPWLPRRPEERWREAVEEPATVPRSNPWLEDLPRRRQPAPIAFALVGWLLALTTLVSLAVVLIAIRPWDKQPPSKPSKPSKPSTSPTVGADKPKPKKQDDKKIKGLLELQQLDQLYKDGKYDDLIGLVDRLEEGGGLYQEDMGEAYFLSGAAFFKLSEANDRLKQEFRVSGTKQLLKARECFELAGKLAKVNEINRMFKKPAP